MKLLAISSSLFLLSAAAPSKPKRQNPPNQSVFIDRHTSNVIGSSGPFRTDTSGFFNPTNTTPPFFQIFDRAFLDILGPSPSIRLIASNESFAFAHEAPIWIPETGEVWFCSDEGGGRAIHSDVNTNNVVSRIRMQEVRGGGDVSITPVTLDPSIQITNGATNYKGQILLVNDGRGNLPPNVVLVNPRPPFNATVLLDNFFGRQFNSLNDVKIHPTSKKVFFTDKTTGWLNHFRPLPDFPDMVYRFDPDTGDVRVVADGFIRSNGIAFTDDGKTAYIGDSALGGGFLGSNSTLPATIYQFDVDPTSETFTNRRVFAYADTGIPDGIQLDKKGNVYSGCGDGVNVWNPTGTLLGKIFLGDSSSNMIFAEAGELVVLSDSNLFFAKIKAEGQDLHGRGLSV
ncbi:D-lactonohydrolase-like protein [Mycena leptocephala]|nr:D-lactonohydrolase-like protein [Mycena leptocephala]